MTTLFNGGGGGGSGGGFSNLTAVAYNINADQNDYALTSPGDVHDFTCVGAGRAITGFVAPATNWELKIIECVGANTLTLQHQNAGSAAANRIICPGGADLILSQYDSVFLLYNRTIGRWIVLA